MKKELKTKISEKPFKLYGYTLSEYIHWCEKNEVKPYDTDIKRIFFKRINDYSIVKINGKIYENGVEI